ncbi:CRAL/TRIO domain-containing protein, partial [Helicosporidium sp. ATCC 50920]
MIKSAVGTKHPPSEDGESEGWSPNRTPNRPTKRREVYKPFPDAVRSEEEFVKDWGITPDEEDKRLADLRRVVEQATGTLRPIFDDLYMRRFLRARGHDVAEAKKMFMRHLKWRQEYGCDGVLEDFVFEERDAVLTIYPQGYHKTDRLGRPIYIQHLGQVDLRKLTAITSEDRMIRFHVQEYERALKYIFPGCSVVAGRAVTQTLAIVDLKGVGLRHLAGDTKRILGDIVRIDSDNYPETLGNTVIINAPGVFKLLWNIVKPMLDTRTQAKIHVASSNYMPDLLKWVDEDSIPAYLGGKSKGSLVDDIGPWQDPAVIAAVERMIASRDGLVSPGSHPRSESQDETSPKGDA